MAKDCKTDLIVAIKIHKSSPCYYENALEECEILQMVSKKMVKEGWNEEILLLIHEEAYRNEGFCVRLLNSFVHFGPLGNHFCMVFEIHGPSLKQILESAVENDVYIEFRILKKMMKQILSGLHFLHSECGVIHTDLKLDKILFSFAYKDLEKILLEELEKEDKFIEFRAREIKRKIKIEKAKISYEKKLENLSKKERKKLRRKMKKMEKKLEKNKNKQIEVIKEQKLERIKDEMRLDLKDSENFKEGDRERRHKSCERLKKMEKRPQNFNENQKKNKKLKRNKSHDCNNINFLKD